MSLGQIKDIGVPDIFNFTKREYDASAQNWQIQRDSKNFMYFANNNGLLEFDGAHWHLYELPNHSIVRSIQIDENDRIYLGQQNEFGYMEADQHGQLQYHSLLPLVSEDERNFEEIWRIHITNDGIIFQSYTHMFVYRNNRVIKVQLENRLRFSFYVNNRLFVQDEGLGLMEYLHGQFKKLDGLEAIAGMEIWTILPIYGSRVLIGTANNGVYVYDGLQLVPWEGIANQFLIDNQIFSACTVGDSYYAFGTIQNGLLITDENGKIIQHINKKKGLQNNTILSLGVDKDENLWLGLDNGIDFIDINSPFTFMYDPEGLGATYTSLVHDGKLYVGTNHGLFVKDWPQKASINEPGFKLVPNTVGQIWYLGVHNDVILCGHDNGTFEITGETALQISEIRGAWMFLQFREKKNYLIGGHYSGLSLFRYDVDQKTWVEEGKISGFNESSKLMAEDHNGVIWMSHGFKGVYSIKLNADLNAVASYKFYNSANGLPSDLYNNLMTIGDQIVFATVDGIYIHNAQTDLFDKPAYYNNIFRQEGSIGYIMEDQYLNIWFAASSVPGVLRFQEDGTYTKVVAPFGNIAGRTIPGFEHINVVDQQNTFITLEDGLAHYTPSYQFNNDEEFKTYVREVINLKDGKMFYPSSISQKLPIDSISFDYKANNLRFTFSSPDFKNMERLQYSYYLENYSSDWTDWAETSNCEFMNLREGEYTFKVKSLDPFTKESETAQFSFIILPPWYRSLLAIIIYIVSALIFIGLSIWWTYHRIQVSKRKERLKNVQEYRNKVQQFQREALVSEKEIIRLRNEKLRGKMIHLDKELANQTMTLIQKNKFLGKLKSELKGLQGQAVDRTVKSKISLIINRIDKEFDDKKQQELFETYFDEVHEDFFKRLTEKYPSLTPREQKLCAYIKMNISTKEIATLQNISTRGVEISRYRLRKKFGIDRETNLGAFISNI